MFTGRSILKLKRHHGTMIFNPITITTTTMDQSRSLLISTRYYNEYTMKSLRFSSSSSAKTTTKSKSNYWKRFALLVRYGRIPILVLSVYGLGYQQGNIDNICDPKGTQDALLDRVLSDCGINSRDDVYCDGDNYVDDIHQKTSLLSSVTDPKKKTPQHRHHIKSVKRIANIGKKILHVGRKHVNEKLEERIDSLRSKFLAQEQQDDDKLTGILKEDEEIRKWLKAGVQLSGDWRFILLDTEVPNAFVTELLPKRIFVTTAMIDGIIQNDDELALTLGHELSHLIHSHNTEGNKVQKLLLTIEILLLSLDPTEGLLSLASMGGLTTLRRGYEAASSREFEREADILGIKLAAMACYDTKRGTDVFRRLGEISKKNNNGYSHTSFIDSHPPSDERYRDLIIASETENANAYPNCCAVVNNRTKKYLLF